MTVAGKSPLGILTVAFAASALLVVLQTVVFQLLPYDSPLTGTVAVALRAGFLAADLAALVGLLALRPRLGPAHALGLMGAALALGGVISGAIGLAVSAMGSSAATLASLGRPLSSAEPMWSLGVTLLASLAIASIARLPARPQVRRLVAAIGVLVALAIAFRIGRLAVPGPRSLGMAWTSWSLEVVRPALVGWLAFLTARGAGKQAAAQAEPEGPYRVAGQGAPAVAPAASGPAAAAAFGKAARALGFYQTIFAIRLAAGIFLPIAMLMASAILRGSAFAPLAVLLLVGIGVSGLGTISAFRLLALPRAAEARGLVIGAALAMGLAMLVDALIGLYGIYSLFAGGRYARDQSVASALSVGWPICVLLGGVALGLVASALARVGELLAGERLVARARWTQALAIFSGALQTGSVLAVLGATSGRSASSSTPGSILLFGMVLLTAGVSLATLIVHLITIGGARAHLQLSMQPSPSASAGL